MTKISFIMSDSGVITAVANAKTFSVAPEHPNYKMVKEAIRKDDPVALAKCVDVAPSIKTFTRGKVEVRKGVVYYNGEAVHNHLTDRILKFMSEGLPHAPLINFMNNLMQNPSKRSVDQLFKFLSVENLPITEDGCFLAYKRVRADWKDFHSQKYNNSIGQSPNMPRNQVDDNPDSACSAGFHAGSLAYVAGFNSGGHVIIIKVNPRDAVSVPTHDCNKLRMCAYTVLAEFKGALDAALYDNKGVAVAVNDEDDWGEEWLEDEG